MDPLAKIHIQKESFFLRGHIQKESNLLSNHKEEAELGQFAG
jgi:hypothetical protein